MIRHQAWTLRLRSSPASADDALWLQRSRARKALHQLALREDADRLRFILVSAYPVLDKVAPNHRLVIARLGKPLDLSLLTEKLEAASVALQDSDG